MICKTCFCNKHEQNYKYILHSAISIIRLHKRMSDQPTKGCRHVEAENTFTVKLLHVNHTIIRAAFVCFLSPPRSFGRSSPNLVDVCRWTSHLPLRGSFSKRSTARRVNGSLSLSTILYMPQPHATQLQRRLLFGKQQSLIRRLLLSCMSTTYVGGPGNCY